MRTSVVINDVLNNSQSRVAIRIFSVYVTVIVVVEIIEAIVLAVWLTNI